MPEYVYGTDGGWSHWLTGEEIVRCRDCEHATDDGYGCTLFGRREQVGNYGWEDVPAEVEPDGFCKWGSRKEGE